MQLNCTSPKHTRGLQQATCAINRLTTKLLVKACCQKKNRLARWLSRTPQNLSLATTNTVTVLTHVIVINIAIQSLRITSHALSNMSTRVAPAATICGIKDASACIFHSYPFASPKWSKYKSMFHTCIWIVFRAPTVSDKSNWETRVICTSVNRRTVVSLPIKIQYRQVQ